MIVMMTWMVIKEIEIKMMMMMMLFMIFIHSYTNYPYIYKTYIHKIYILPYIYSYLDRKLARLISTSKKIATSKGCIDTERSAHFA